MAKVKKIKIKTHRGAAKRFKRTKNGKFLRGKAFSQHILTSKTTKRKRGLRGTTTVADVAVAETTPRMEGNQMHTILTRKASGGGGKPKPAATTTAR